MKTAAILAVAGVAAAAAAQSIDIDVANPTLMPGESTTVTLSAGYGGSDYAVAGVATDFISSVGSAGWSDVQLLAPMNGPGTSTGAASGTGVDGIIAGQLNFPPAMFVFPSLTDTLGQVVLESQASGIPVVVADQGGPKEVVDDGRTGLVLPGHKTSAWIDAVSDLVIDHDKRKAMGATGVPWAQNFSISASFEKFWTAHEALIETPALQPA